MTITSVIETEQHWKFRWLLPEVTPELVAEIGWLTPDFVDEEGKMILRIQALVLEWRGQTVVIDTCVGNHKDRPTPLFNDLNTTFLDDFRAAGFQPDQVDVVFCTHLHVDHVGWNTTLVAGGWVPTFPNARHLFCRSEYDHWAGSDDAAVFGDVMGDSVTPIVDAGLAEFVDADAVINEAVRLEPTVGHTPGHCSVRITSDGADAVITGDMVHHPVQLHDPSIASSADVDAAAAIATRRHSFGEWSRSGTLVIGTHFAGVGATTLTARADGDGWVPANFVGTQ